MMSSMLRDGQPFQVMPKPSHSIIIPCFNAAHFLPDALASIDAQNLPDPEIIIVDDASEDTIEDAISAYATHPIEVIRLAKNSGPSAARNVGIKRAKADYLLFLDADDVWTPDWVMPMHAHFRDNDELGVVMGQLEFGQFVDGKWAPDLEQSHPFLIASALYHKRAFDQVGLFDESLRFAEDGDWYLRLVDSSLAYKQVPNIILHYRQHDTNSTRTESLKVRNSYMFQLMRKRIQLNKNGA